MSKKLQNWPSVLSVVVFCPSSCNVACPKTPAVPLIGAWVRAAAATVVAVDERAVRCVLHSSFWRSNEVIDDKHQFYFSLIIIDVIEYQKHLVN